MPRPLVTALLLAACATARRPAPPPVDTAPTAHDPATEVAYTTEPVPLTPEARAAIATAGEQYTNERFDEAEATLRAALERHPDDRAVRLRYALLHVENGQPERAVPFLREGLRRVPDDADLWTSIGRVRLRQAVDGAPRSAADTDAAQRVHAWLEAARDAFAEALRARGNHLGAMEGSAVIASRLGAHADAARMWERVIRLTHDRDAEEHLADAVAAAGHRHRAIGLYEGVARATLALGGFDTPASRAALQRLVADPDLGLDAHAALYQLTRAPEHLRAIERAPAAQHPHAEWLLAGYIERAGTPQATAAATRARAAMQARLAAEEAAARAPIP